MRTEWNDSGWFSGNGGRCFVMFLALSFAGAVSAAEYFVDQVKGSDDFDGLKREPGDGKTGPTQTITRAAHLAGPGDTVTVLPSGGDYRQTVDLYRIKDGEPGNPITINGNGVWINGADPCPKDAWKDEGNGLWSLRGMPFTGQLVIDGKLRFCVMEHDLLQPGEFCYMPNSYNRLFYKPESKQMPKVEVEQNGAMVELDPAKWQHSGITGVVRYNGLSPLKAVRKDGVDIALVHARDRLQPGQFCVQDKVLYIRPPEGKTPAQMGIESVVRGTGIQMGGGTKHIVIKNFNARYVYNDGYNIHGGVQNISFYNCNAEDCGDEGFSSHDKCQTLLDGATYIRCDNGINNVNAATSVTRNVILAFSRHNGYECQQNSDHTLENAILVDNPNQLCGTAKRLVVDNVLIVRTATGPTTTAISVNLPENHLSRITAVGNSSLIRCASGNPVNLENCLFGADQGGMHLRTENSPLPAMPWKDVILGGGLQISWRNSKWVAFAPWLDEAGASLKTSGVSVQAEACRTLDLLANRQAPVLPEALKTYGCTPQLYERYLDFIKRYVTENAGAE